MICTVHQPNYLPYSGFFEKAFNSDVFVIYDTTQFKKNDWQNRNRLCTKNGWQWVSVPILHDFGQKIFETKIDLSRKPLQKNWQTIKTVYGHAPFFKKYEDLFCKIYTDKYEYVSALNYDLIMLIAGILGLKTKFIKSSELPPIQTFSTDALIDICKYVNADTYISGSEGKNYLETEKFEKENIKLIFQKYIHPVYPQFNNDSFISHMSVIDLIFNCGENSLEVILNRRSGF